MNRQEILQTTCVSDIKIVTDKVKEDHPYRVSVYWPSHYKKSNTSIRFRKRDVADEHHYWCIGQVQSVVHEYIFSGTML